MKTSVTALLRWLWSAEALPYGVSGLCIRQGAVIFPYSKGTHFAKDKFSEMRSDDSINFLMWCSYCTLQPRHLPALCRTKSCKIATGRFGAQPQLGGTIPILLLTRKRAPRCPFSCHCFLARILVAVAKKLISSSALSLSSGTLPSSATVIQVSLFMW